MRKKYFMFVALLCVIVIVSGGCVSSSEEKYKAQTLSTLQDGYYIKNEDKFYPLVSEGKTYSGMLSNFSSKGQKQVVWITKNRNNIPVLNKNTQLVVKSEDALNPDSILQYMCDYGTTIGMTFSKTKDPNVYGLINESKRAVCKGSNAEALLNKYTSNLENIRFVEVGGVALNQDMLTDMNTVKGLKEDNEYAVSFYEGTTYHKAKVIADTHVFVSDPNTRFPIASYKYSEDGYVQIVLPSNMLAGYYYLDDVGIFYYDKEI